MDVAPGLNRIEHAMERIVQSAMKGQDDALAGGGSTRCEGSLEIIRAEEGQWARGRVQSQSEAFHL